MPINHIVMFQFKDSVSESDAKLLCSNMLALKGACVRGEAEEQYITSLTGGKDMSIEGMQAGHHYAFVVQFANQEDRDYYVKEDKAHGTFVKNTWPYIAKATVVDYEF
ncbi:stress responsive A/B barrel domain-containing protein [Xylaria sp. CBS 124048]|nr:stress responsive A/B barrel domain-containing protein [Xylaria sp. CBS 124048]